MVYIVDKQGNKRLQSISLNMLYLQVPGNHRANQEAQEWRGEQLRILKLQYVCQDQRAEVYLVNIGHLES